MKTNKILCVAGLAAAFCACSKIDEISPADSNYTQAQIQEVNESDPTRAEAAFSGMFTKLGKPKSCFPNSSRVDDFGFIMIALSNDVEGADAHFPNNDYNWFSVCGEYTSRTASYANPYIRYKAPYNTIYDANDIINQFPNDKNKIAQAKAIRAYAYQQLAPFFMGRIQEYAEEPCVPIVTEQTTNFTQNPRATVKEVWDFIIQDLTDAIADLDVEDAPARANCATVDKHVAYGLRARAYLTVGKYAEAYDDAVKAAEGYTVATAAELSTPSFKDISEHNWIWGYDMTAAVAQIDPYCTSSSWTRSFSGDGYAPATGTYLCCNNLLYDKIPADDVRKGWWVNENLESPLLENQTWGELKGNDIAKEAIADVKMQFLPYTNVKFGCNKMGTVQNDEDFPLMRVEEMILIQAECKAALDETAAAQSILEAFVQTRCPGYTYGSTYCGQRSLMNEIWFQRRVELWGEGFFVPDARRLNKPIVRTHGSGTSNVSDDFCFNIAPDDPWLNMRFSDAETNTNFAIVDNTGGNAPKSGQGSDLRDGVTD